MKKLLLCLIFVGALFLPINVSAIDTTTALRVTNQKTPVDVSQVTKTQSLKTGYGQDPILYGDYLYAVDTSTYSLLQINKETMQIKKSVKAIVNLGGWTPYIAAGDGKIFVSLSDGRVQAFDAETLVSLWVSENQGILENVTSQLTYYDGYLYYGLGGSIGKDGIPYVCLKVNDEDSSQQFETKRLEWSYNEGQGYYWSGGVVVGDCIAFAGYDGKLVLHDLKTGEVYDTIDLSIDWVKSVLTYDQKTKRIIASGIESGTSDRKTSLASVEINGHNIIDSTIVRTEKLSSANATSPVAYNGRVYISDYGKSFKVLDAKTLNTIYSLDNLYGQSTPLISTAYATDDNNQEVQIYFIRTQTDDNGQTHLYHITDNEIQKEPVYETLYTLDSSISSNYWNGSIVLDKDAFYAYNGNGTVVKFGFDTSIQTTKDEQAIVNTLNKKIQALPSIDNVSVKIASDLEQLQSSYSKLSQEYKKKVIQMDKVNQLQTIIKKQNEMIKKLNEDIVNQLNIYYLSLDDVELVNQLVQQYQNIHIANQSLIQNYQDVITAQKIIKDLKQGMIPSDIFENMYGNDISYTISHQTSDNYKYKFTFHGQDLKSTKPFNFKVSNTSKRDQSIYQYAQDAFIIDLEFSGEFPGKATFEIETNLEDGKYVLYYYNEKTQKIEKVQDVVIKDGVASMTLTHASTYFISKEIPDTQLNRSPISTSDETLMILPLIGVILAGIGIIVLIKKKK